MDVKSQACFVSVDMLAMSFILHQLLAIWSVPVEFPSCNFFKKNLASCLFSVNNAQHCVLSNLQEVPNVVICLGYVWYFGNE